MFRRSLVVRWCFLLVVAGLWIPSGSKAADEDTVRKRAGAFYSTLAGNEFSATWEMLSKNVAEDTTKGEYIRKLEQVYPGNKLSFEVGQARIREPGKRADVIANLKLIRGKDGATYNIRHLTIWVFEKERGNWFFDGESAQPTLYGSPSDVKR